MFKYIIVYFLSYLFITCIFDGQVLANNSTDSMAYAVLRVREHTTDSLISVNKTNFNSKADSLKKHLLSSPNIIYASKICALNSNINTGGGTDDIVPLQAAVDFLYSIGGGTLVVDGVALISKTLILKSNVKIQVIDSGGVYLKDHSNCHMLTTVLTGRTISNYNVAVEGGTWNGNYLNQSKCENNDDTKMWNFGFWFGSVDGYSIKNVKLINAVTFGITLTQTYNGSIENCQTLHYQANPYGNFWDGIHIWSNAENLSIKNFRSDGNDDVIGLNGTEGLACNDSRIGTTGDSLINITIDSLFFDHSKNGIRFWGWNDVNYTYMDYITIRNVYGDIWFWDMSYGYAYIKHLTIDGWYVEGHNTINIDPQGLHLNSNTILYLNNINPTATVNISPKIIFAHCLGNYFNHNDSATEAQNQDAFALFQNYPNPFNPSTTISFSLQSKSFVTLKIFDTMGREIATLIAGELSAGNHTVRWNATNISSGVYYYRLQAGTFLETKKLVLLH